MPLSERRLRWEAMMAKICSQTIQQWFADFIEALQDTGFDRAELEPVVSEPPLWPRRSGDRGARYHW
jgi:trehalose 6-phosphate synthase